jgi:peptidoglycan hydrolase CwlO-like protein
VGILTRFKKWIARRTRKSGWRYATVLLICGIIAMSVSFWNVYTELDKTLKNTQATLTNTQATLKSTEGTLTSTKSDLSKANGKIEAREQTIHDREQTIHDRNQTIRNLCGQLSNQSKFCR